MNVSLKPQVCHLQRCHEAHRPCPVWLTTGIKAGHIPISHSMRNGLGHTGKKNPKTLLMCSDESFTNKSAWSSRISASVLEKSAVDEGSGRARRAA